MQKSKNHYRFTNSREILLIGDDVYAAPVTNGFDPDGYRLGAQRLMSRKDWDDMHKSSFDSGSLILNDTTIEFNPAYVSKPFLQDQCVPYWREFKVDSSWYYQVNISNDCNIHECLAEIKPRPDKRFNVFLKGTKFHKNRWNFVASQKVCGTIDEAKGFIESCWTGPIQECERSEHV